MIQLRPLVFLLTLLALLTGANSLLKPQNALADVPVGWETRNSSGARSVLSSISFADDNNGWAVGINSIVRTRDGGKSWFEPWKSPQSYWFNSVAALSPQVAMATGFAYGREGASVVLRTDDGGASWRPVAAGRPDAAYHSIVFRRDKRVGYLISTSEGLMKTSDGGQSWNAVPVPIYLSAVFVGVRGTIALPDDRTIYVGGNDSKLLRSNDDGRSWDIIELPAAALSPHRQFLWVRFASASRGWVEPFGGGVWETRDGGKNWSKSAIAGLPAMQDARNGWLIAGREVYRTSDGGATWTDETTVAPRETTLLALALTARRVHVAGGNEGAAVSTLADRLLPGVVEAVNTEVHAPIPVRFSLPSAGFVTLVIENSAGKRIRNLISETRFPAGQNVVWWDGLDDLGRDFEAANHAVFHIPGKLVAPGSYRVRGLFRAALDAKYEMTVYSAGQPSWYTGAASSMWLANHTPPAAVLFVPPGAAPQRAGLPSSAGGQILVSSEVAEGGSGLAWLDVAGKKLHGHGSVGGPWTGATHLARDEGERALAGIYAYSASAWEGELRLSQFDRQIAGAGAEDRPVLTPNWKFPDKAPSKISGLAAHNGLLVVSLPQANQLLFVDAKARRVLGTAPLPDPRGLAFDRQGRLLALAGKKLLRFSLGDNAAALPAPQTVIASGLQDPQQLALDGAGQIYISDRGSSHQVKVFSPDGALLRAVGKPGTPRVGPYNPDHMNNPNGVSLDNRGRLWVAETDSAPKRVSVWNADSTLADAFYGPMQYGNGGELDGRDKTLFYYGGAGGTLEFKLDWKSGQNRLISVLTRDEINPAGLPNAWYSAMPPQSAFYRGSRRYLTSVFNTSPTNGAGLGVLYRVEGSVAIPCAALGRAHDWPLIAGELKKSGSPFRARLPQGVKPDDDLLMSWSDADGDGIPQASEVAFAKAATGAVTLMPDFAFVVARVGEKTMRYAPVSWSAAGVPQYDLTRGQVLAQGAQVPTTSGGDQALVAPGGATVLTVAPKPFAPQGLGGVNNGASAWSYPSLWPGLHASHNAPLPNARGQLLGTTRLLGGLVTPRGSDAGPLFAVNGNKGNVYVFTADGLFVATLFQDSRVAAFDAPTARRGQSMMTRSLGEENFWPTWTQTADGAIYLSSNSVIMRLEGLESIRRLPTQTLNVTPPLLEQARQGFVKSEIARQRNRGENRLRVALRGAAPVVDGKLDDWNGAAWATIDERRTQLNDFYGAMKKTEVALSIAGDRLYAAFKTDDPNLLSNSGQSLPNLFKHGGALDVMLGNVPGGQRLLVTRVKGRTTAMLYRAKVAGGAPNPVSFTSNLGATRTVSFDRVQDVSGQVQLAGDGANYELSVPLSLLELNVQNGQTISGDAGVLRGNGSQALQRVYWSNKATGLTSDLASEAELTPQLWGTWEFVAG